MQISISNIVKGTVIGSAFTAISRYFTRVTQAGAIYEKPLCVESGINSSPLLQQASMLILPSGYKGGTAYAELPSNGNGDLTWTRASDAWRTNSDGLIQRVPWNLLTNSNELASQQLQALGKYTVSSNVAISPDGTQTADKFIITGTDSYQGVVKTPIPNGTYTISMFAKASGKNWVFFYEIGSPSGTNGVWFNISTGQIGSIGSAWSNVTITNVGNDWYRCSATTTLSATNYLYWLVSDSNSNPTVTANGTDGVLMWGLQFVEGTTAQTYLRTTDRLNFPRLSYMYGSCPAVLLEPQRTNLALWSEDITSAVWLKARLNTTANTTTSPDGTTNADTIAANGSNSDHTLYNLYTTTEGTAYTFSCYLKANTGRYVLLRIMTTGATFRYGITFDLQTGTITQTSTTATAPTGTTSSVTSVGNGWYRISLTLTASGTQSGVIVATSNSATPTLNANLDYVYTGSESYYLYGMQLEAGAYPTTYIPTTSATATRVADSFSRNNIYANGLISASGGTWFVELRNNIGYTRDAIGTAIQITDGTFQNLVRLRYPPSGRIIIDKVVSNVGTFLVATTATTCKLAIKWNGTTMDIFENGTKVVSATSFTPTIMETLSGDGAQAPMFIQQMALFNSALTDTQCQTLTT